MMLYLSACADATKALVKVYDEIKTPLEEFNDGFEQKYDALQLQWRLLKLSSILKLYQSNTQQISLKDFI